MTRNKHPQTRAERLKYKLEHGKKNSTKDHEGQVRRKLYREHVKDAETKDALQAVTANPGT